MRFAMVCDCARITRDLDGEVNRNVFRPRHFLSGCNLFCDVTDLTVFFARC